MVMYNRNMIGKYLPGSLYFHIPFIMWGAYRCFHKSGLHFGASGVRIQGSSSVEPPVQGRTLGLKELRLVEAALGDAPYENIYIYTHIHMNIHIYVYIYIYLYMHTYYCLHQEDGGISSPQPHSKLQEYGQFSKPWPPLGMAWRPNWTKISKTAHMCQKSQSKRQPAWP